MLLNNFNKSRLEFIKIFLFIINSDDKLDDKHKSVFSLRHFEGFSLKEIAETLNINEGTVKSRLFYATKTLAGTLKEFNPIYNQ